MEKQKCSTRSSSESLFNIIVCWTLFAINTKTCWATNVIEKKIHTHDPISLMNFSNSEQIEENLLHSSVTSNRSLLSEANNVSNELSLLGIIRENQTNANIIEAVNNFIISSKLPEDIPQTTSETRNKNVDAGSVKVNIINSPTKLDVPVSFTADNESTDFATQSSLGDIQLMIHKNDNETDIGRKVKDSFTKEFDKQTENINEHSATEVNGFHVDNKVSTPYLEIPAVLIKTHEVEMTTQTDTDAEMNASELNNRSLSSKIVKITISKEINKDIPSTVINKPTSPVIYIDSSKRNDLSVNHQNPGTINNSSNVQLSESVDNNDNESVTKKEPQFVQTSLPKHQNYNATLLFIRLLKENIALKTLLYHISNTKLTVSTVDPISFAENTTEIIINQPEEPLKSGSVDSENVFESTSLEIEMETTSDSSQLHQINDTEQLLSLSNDSQRLGLDNITSDYEYYDYYENQHAHSIKEINHLTKNHSANKSRLNSAFYSESQPITSKASGDELNTLHRSMDSTVRKCCSPDQFFSLETQGCEESGGPTNFHSLLHELVSDDTIMPLDLLPGRLQICPGTDDPPSIHIGISNLTHLLDQGLLYSFEKDVHYNHDVYCLELVGQSPDNANLTVAFCDTRKSDVSVNSIRKCCPIGQYYDAVLVGCANNTTEVHGINQLVLDLSGTYNDNTTIIEGTLTCQQGHPDLVDSGKVYLSNSDQLCVSHTGRCYPSTMYCIEYVWSSDADGPQPSAVYCPLDSFQKCCPTHQILQNDLCIDSDVFLSPFVTQLMATMNSQIGFPLDNDEICVHLLLDAHDNLRWWVTNSGYLAIDSGEKQVQTKNYCVDDSLEPSNEIITMAYVCSNELKQSVVLPISVFDAGTIGKCCPPDHHLSQHGDCAKGGSYNALDHDPLLLAANITKLGYTGFPHCLSGKFHLFTFAQLDEDHVEFGGESKLYVISLDGKCVERKSALATSDFCIDYGWNSEDPEFPSVIVCVPEWDSITLHTEKFNLTAAMLGVSCCSLLIALVCLICMRVRRGLVTVRKVGSYITDYIKRSRNTYIVF